MVGLAGHGSSRNRSMPGAAGFLVLSQALLGPDRYGCASRGESVKDIVAQPQGDESSH
jgi:hypothetical protein